MVELLSVLATSFVGVSDVSDVYEATLEATEAVLDPDCCLIVRNEDDGLVTVDGQPPDACGAIASLPPVSVPALCLSEDESCLIDDQAATRSVQATDGQRTALSEYRTLATAPFDTDHALVCGCREPNAISQDEFDRFQDIAAYAGTVLETVPETTGERAEVASVLSHDARNIITVIHSRLTLLRDDGDLDRLDDIEQALDRLEGLIDGVVTLLRTGDRELDRKPVAVEAVAAEAWQTIETQEATLRVDATAQFEADESCLTEIVANLFANAIEHGGADVTVHVGLLEDREGFYVEDTGEGIPPEEREQIFEYGYSSEREHSGLGLNIVQWLVDAHGWDIAVTDGDAGGARFEITTYR